MYSVHFRIRGLLILLVATALLVSCATKKVKAPQPPSKPKAEYPYVPGTPVTARNGMAVTAHPIASKLSADILSNGGNAASAAVTALAALSVVEPQASGLGGGGFALYYDAVTQKVSVIDYRETAPAAVVPDSFYQPTDSFRVKLQSTGSAILTPGAPLGWQTLSQRYANRSVSDLLKPVIELADSGYVPSPKQCRMILEHAEDLSENEPLFSLFAHRDEDLKISVLPRLYFKTLAGTYRNAAFAGTFTNAISGENATSIQSTIQTAHGYVTASDLSSYKVVDREPLHISYRGYDIYSLPAPSAGGTAVLLALKLLEQVDLAAMGWQSPEQLHIVAEAIRQGMTDGFVWGGDPSFVPIFTDRILANSYYQTAFAKLPRDTVREKAAPFDTATSHGNTTHLVVTDKAGNLVSITQSINYFFGSQVWDPKTGILFNNHATDFDWRAARRGSIEHGKRPGSWMSPVIVLKNGKPWLVAGSPGGPRIPAAMVELLVAAIDFKLPLQEALDAPRYFPNGSKFEYEPRLPESSLKSLAKKGWVLKVRGQADPYFGGAQAAMINEDGSVTGAGDPRRDGAPAAAK